MIMDENLNCFARVDAEVIINVDTEALGVIH